MIRRLAVLLTAAGVLAPTAVDTSAAVTRKPLAYRYGKCASKTSPCTFEGMVGPTNNKVSISTTTICSVGGEALGRLGYVPIKHAKFSINKTVTYESFRTYRTESVKVQESGTLKAGKSVVGTLKITTSNAECASESGVAKPFTLKYLGAYYGG